MTNVWPLAALGALVLANALFVAAEFAIVIPSCVAAM
jgi:hypothetical protein